MNLFTAIETRSSSIKLVAPGPAHADLERILLAGTRAPDHGKLSPWRFAVLEGAARNLLGDAMAETLRAARSDCSKAQLDAERGKPLRAPTIIAVAAHLVRLHKVPELEQIQAVAAAVQNMFLAAHALGFGVMWKTGAATRAPRVREALGFAADEEVIAFLYLGTNAVPGPVRAGSLENKVRWMA